LIESVAKAHEATIAEVSISWSLSQPGVSSTVVGTQNPRHFQSNLNATELNLTEEEIKSISDASSETLAKLKRRGLL
jgi:aryl-alcohol dehydrogenase-like predicted oxidoreductase